MTEFPNPTTFQVMIRLDQRVTDQQAADLAALPDPAITIHHTDDTGTLLTARITSPQMSDAITLLSDIAHSLLPEATISQGQAVAVAGWLQQAS